MKKKTTRRKVDNEENLSKYMSSIIKKRKQNQEFIIGFSFEPKSPTRKMKLRTTPPKKTQEKKPWNKTPDENKFKKKK